MKYKNTGNGNSGYGNSGNYNSGGCNSGNSNSGYYNSGGCNSGGCNSGNGNSGNYNSGYGNSGNYNSGGCNSGGCNSGNGNSGNYNSGNSNSGYYNSGNGNSGYYNSGYGNSGNGNSGSGNSGYYNSGNGNSGYFNTNKPTMRIFNVDSGLRKDEIDLPYIQLKISEWIVESKMTDAQKSRDKDFHVKEGTLITRTYHEAWELYWAGINKKDRQKFLDLPNFNAEMFKEITGIDVESKTCNNKIVEIDGKKYKLQEIK